jgi:leader peptidase (prepilin peptidase)/N-methyltransferase
MPISENPVLTNYFLFFSFALGCIVGSFLNVVVWRLPRGASLCRPPSHCPNCGHFIRSWENIPILSWLFLRGRCSSCHQGISWRYPAGEGATGLLFAGIFWHLLRVGLPLAVLPGYFWLAGAVLAAALIDAEYRIIPNQITYSGMIVAFLLAILLPQSRLSLFNEPDLAANGLIVRFAIETLSRFQLLHDLLGYAPVAAALDCLLGIAMGGGILALFAWAGKLLMRQFKPKIQVIGGGDVKFLAMIGAFLGADATIYILLGGAFLGFLTGIVLVCRKKNAKKLFSSLPFAPFLAIPTLGWLLFGNWLYYLMRG